MSHNGRYYVKKLTKKDASKCKKLDVFGFKKNIPQTDTESVPAAESECKHDDVDMIVETDKPSTRDTKSSNVIDVETDKPSTSDTKSSSVVDKSETVSVIKKSDVVSVPDARLFSSRKYETRYSWLYYSVTKEGYVCKYCELFDPFSEKNFIGKGVQLGTHPTRQLERHNSSTKHSISLERYINCTTQVNVYKQLCKQSKSRESKNREVLKKLFKCAYFLVLQKWAVTENFEIFVRFVATLGIEDLKHHIESADPKATYLSSTSVTELIKIISEHFERQLLTSLRGKPFSFLADESTDSANRTQLSVMGRWNINGEVNDHYLGFINVEKTTAEALMQAIQTFAVSKAIDLSDVRFLGFDGCNTMSGQVKGLQKRMRHVSPTAIYINCRNHRLALCLVHLIKQYNLLQDVDATLIALWKMFEYSPHKFKVFKHVQEAYGQKGLTFIRAATTRWLSHLKACQRFISRYESIIDCLDAIYEDKKEPEVFGIRMNVTRKDLVAMTLLLCDILKPVNMLSLYLQEEQVNFTMLAPRVQDTLDELSELCEKYQSNNYDDTDFSLCQSLFDEINDRTDLARRIRNDHAAREITPAQFLESVAVPFIYSLMNEIQDAFHCSPVLSAFGFLDPRNMPATLQELDDYGNGDIEQLAKYYGEEKTDVFQGHRSVAQAEFDSAATTRAELKDFKRQLFMMRQRGVSTIRDVFCEMNRDGVIQGCYPRVFKLVEFSLLIPASTAVVERGFSLMNNLCTPLRSSLTQNSLDALMRICSEGKDELSDVELDAMVQTFKTLKKRKIAL